MAKNVGRISHVKSNVVNEGKPKLPNPSALVEGELAVNYAKGYETISLKDSEGNIVRFSSDNYYSEQKLGSAFTGANSAVTVTDALENFGQEVEVNSGITPSEGTVEIWVDESIDPVTVEVYTKGETNSLLDEKLDVTAYTPTDLTNYYTKSETSGATEISTALGDKADVSSIPSVSEYADSVKYNSTTKYVEFYHGTTAGTKVFEYDASPFIIDGMVQNVEIKDVTSGSSTVKCLVISFNTDAGKQDINIPLIEIFDPSNYYTKSETSGSTEISNALGTKVNSSTYTAYTASTATDIGNKLSTSDFNTYSGAVDTTISSKAAQSDLNTLSGTVTGHTADTNIHFSGSEKANLDSLATNIAAISGVTSTKISNWDAAATSAHTHTNKSTLDAITASSTAINSLTGAVGTMAFQNASSYSSATEVNSALALKGDKSDVDDLIEQSEVISASLNDLNERKFDASGITNYTTTATTSALNNVVTAHTANTTIHLTSTEKEQLHTHSNKSYLDTVSGNVGTMAYENTTSYSSATQVNSALTEINTTIEDLTRTVVMSITTTEARGYGESNPTLAKYTGDKDKLNGVLSHFKLGWFDGNGKLVKECAPGRISAARDKSDIAIDGTVGDLLVYVDTDIYRDRATVSGLSVTDSTATTHNVIGLGLAPHQVGGKVAKKFEPFAFTPHCAKYNAQNKAYSYYDGGNVQTYINALTSSIYARNKGGGYIGLYYDFYETWLIAMYLELGTLDFTQRNLFGYGCTNETPTANDWFSNTYAGGGGCLFSGNTYGSFWGNTVSDWSYTWCGMLEPQRIMDGVVKAGLVDSMGGTVMMTFDGSGNVVLASDADPSSWEASTGMTADKKYFTVKNVEGCQGLGDGVMTGVVNIYVKGTDRIRKYSHPIYRGLDLLSGFFTQLEGINHVVFNDTGSNGAPSKQMIYAAENYTDIKFPYTSADGSSYVATTSDTIPILSGFTLVADNLPANSQGYAKETDYNSSLFACNIVGASLHTYECGHFWRDGHSYYPSDTTHFTSNYVNNGYQAANASVVGCYASYADAGRTLAADNSVSHSYDYFAGGFAHPHITV